jgi:hypothetical protein
LCNNAERSSSVLPSKILLQSWRITKPCLPFLATPVQPTQKKKAKI